MLRLPRAVDDIRAVSFRGKVQTYAFALLECHDCAIVGLSFFGTTVLVYDSQRPSIISCSFSYPSASRRSLGGNAVEFDSTSAYGIPADIGMQTGLRPDAHEYTIDIPSLWIGRRPWMPYYTQAVVTDNEIKYSEGPGLACGFCGYDLFENNVVLYAAHPFGRSLQFRGTDTAFVTLRRNTLDWSGSGAIAWLWGPGNVAELNRVSHSGMLIIDNEGIQGGRLTSNSTFRFNWVHE